MNGLLRILVIDDCPATRNLLCHFVKQSGHHAIPAEDEATGRTIVRDQQPDCVLIDYQLGETNGLDFIRNLVLSGAPLPPIVMVTGEGNEAVAVEAMKLGAQDYLRKDEISKHTLHRAMMHAIKRLETQRELEEKNQRIQRLADDLMQLNSKLSLANRKDLLTGLSNRIVFEEAIQTEHHRATRHGRPFAVVMLDLDSFKQYNDELGHQAGDECLRRVANAIASSVRDEDITARYGGEEFVMLLPETDMAGGIEIAERIRATIENLRIPHPQNATGGGLVTASLGVAQGPASDWETVLKRADEALYRVKHAGRNRVHADNASSLDSLSLRTAG